MASAVAGIVDAKGGLRVVVTQRWRMSKHVKKGERLFIVPDLLVKEPVPWDDIPPLIETVQRHVVRTAAPINHCGECRACCFELFIDDPSLRKPSKSWCEHCDKAVGCKNYLGRPIACRGFECHWLASQKRNDRMAPELRPDRCGAIFRNDTENDDALVIECHGEPNADAWRWINEMQSVGYRVKKVTHYNGEKE